MRKATAAPDRARCRRSPRATGSPSSCSSSRARAAASRRNAAAARPGRPSTARWVRRPGALRRAARSRAASRRQDRLRAPGRGTAGATPSPAPGPSRESRLRGFRRLRCSPCAAARRDSHAPRAARWRAAVRRRRADTPTCRDSRPTRRSPCRRTGFRAEAGSRSRLPRHSRAGGRCGRRRPCRRRSRRGRELARGARRKSAGAPNARSRTSRAAPM